jgi:putative phosphoribosyl transferase
LATLLFDLLAAEEEAIDARTGHLRFDIDLLAERLVQATEWVSRQAALRDLTIGYFGASTGPARPLWPPRAFPIWSRSWCRAVGGPTLPGRCSREPGTLAAVARLAREWFTRFLVRPAAGSTSR